ncbi:hypothetical protein B0T14DRAFT_251753, partial [Immersiella caudata]
MPLPRRVLNLSLSDNSDGEVCLHESLRDESGSYICLSHCWGGVTALQTTRSNLQARKLGISRDDVPQTFRDAIFVTQGWAYNISGSTVFASYKMTSRTGRSKPLSCAQSNRNASLTVAATRCQDSTGALFPPFQRTVNSFDGAGVPITVALHVRSPHLDMQVTGSRYPLLERGWFFQERLLSRGVVHFGYDETFWECMTCSDCECQCLDMRGGSILDPPLKSILHWNSTKAPPISQQEVWHRLVGEHTDLSLTYPTDREIAIMGLVGEMRPYSKGLYLRGLWQDSIISDLAWMDSVPAPARSKRGPTWSWCNVDTCCHYLLNSVCAGDVKFLG